MLVYTDTDTALDAWCDRNGIGGEKFLHRYPNHHSWLSFSRFCLLPRHQRLLIGGLFSGLLGIWVLLGSLALLGEEVHRRLCRMEIEALRKLLRLWIFVAAWGDIDE